MRITSRYDTVSHPSATGGVMLTRPLVPVEETWDKKAVSTIHIGHILATDLAINPHVSLVDHEKGKSASGTLVPALVGTTSFPRLVHSITFIATDHCRFFIFSPLNFLVASVGKTRCRGPLLLFRG